MSLTKNDESKKTGMSWVTVKKHFYISQKKTVVTFSVIKYSRNKANKLSLDLIYDNKIQGATKYNQNGI